jgi:hypothetical protein
LFASSLLLASGEARADAAPNIVRDSVQVSAFTVNSFHKDFDMWSWLPRIRIHPDNQHTSKVFRLGKVNDQGRIQIVFSTEQPVDPEPYPDSRTHDYGGRRS